MKAYKVSELEVDKIYLCRLSGRPVVVWHRSKEKFNIGEKEYEYEVAKISYYSPMTGRYERGEAFNGQLTDLVKEPKVV